MAETVSNKIEKDKWYLVYQRGQSVRGSCWRWLPVECWHQRNVLRSFLTSCCKHTVTDFLFAIPLILALSPRLKLLYSENSFFSGRASVSACMCASVWLLVWLIAANFMLTCVQPVPAVYWQKKTNFRKQECWPGYKPQHGDGNDDEDDDWPQPGPSYSHGTGSAGCQPQGIRLMNV